jgi:hypothetical protein
MAVLLFFATNIRISVKAYNETIQSDASRFLADNIPHKRKSAF